MLIEFRVSNFRSLGEEQVLSFVPAPKQKDYTQNIFVEGKYQALNVIAIYGANASGKSNILNAMNVLDRMVNLSGRSSSTSRLDYDPFLLRDGWDKKPTQFEVTFIVQNVRFRYGFEYDLVEIKKEWLFRKQEGREVLLFQRELDEIDVSSGFKGSKKIIDAAIEATRSNALFLSTCDSFNLEDAKVVLEWFWRFRMIDGLNTVAQEFQTVELLKKPAYKDKIKTYLKNLEINIVDLEVSEKDFNEADLPDSIPISVRSDLARVLAGSNNYTISASHQIYDANGKPSSRTKSWSWKERESSGAKKAFQLSGPVLWSLANGGVLIIDEIEAQLHPKMTLSLIDVFLDPKSNPNQTQLVFSTHDTNLLTYSKLRRDQICFAEKNEWESTELFSLSDVTYLGEKERPDTDKEKRYFEGRYGAIPVFGEFKNYIHNLLWQKGES